MTQSKEYQKVDGFKRYLIREIKAGRDLLVRGWDEKDCPLPVSVDALEAIKRRYDRFLKSKVNENGR
jgi:hypothetical protein